MNATNATSYLEPTQEAGRQFMQRNFAGPVVMLNLLRLRVVADYSSYPELAPVMPISGAQAYERYIEHTLPFLRASGGEILFLGEAGHFLIGPADERWDLAMLVRQASAGAFVSFASDTGYLAGLGHRSAAVEDSRLLPLSELPFSAIADPAGL
ncbi:DUF1330 domain-containing protein [Hyphomicrobium sulfonivorans]|uniref:DUF1330 domain-containing protein n=1 Tax=Hyphomicrobium sulfonivorans TaxID=121290 RepID=UPI00156F874E|nr:DUF1330 domain-containing protein [Hyphomicrobium sulfonivorans]MBI1650565.1 DUF1330 domain-containing protein [Hyphomicrobium sulfonivorans]NSL72076.1 DUF1330 domain-containing protein [Hyphomicrobium sulfonivorans]